MLAIVVGFKTPSQDSEATAIYVGNDCEAAQKAVAAIKEGQFASVRQFNNPPGFPVRIPTKAELDAEKAIADAKIARAKAAKEAAESEAAAKAAAAKPELADQAAKEKAEAEAAEAAAKEAEAKAEAAKAAAAKPRGKNH
jgi:colicin import membrane protein